MTPLTGDGASPPTAVVEDPVRRLAEGMRVLNLVDEPTRRAAAPVATPEKREAEGA